ncbi:MAG: hypothetical protein H7Z38_24255 [Rubrivivax sp.]|nr:hypothetical protein [Pyrinomonadaceae bacterium]
MKLSAIRIFAACLFLMAVCVCPSSAHGQTRQPSARKFDEFTEGIGSPYLRWYGNYEAQEKVLKARFRRYADQLRNEGARPYAITYSPRVVEWEIYNRSIAGMRAGALWTYQTPPGFDWRQINWVNGGFREMATTELWIVPPGASPPCPTPTVKPEDVAYCPSVGVEGATYIPNPTGPVQFKAVVRVNSNKISPTYFWTVSQGNIVGGQGTETIGVELPAGASGEVLAKVEVRGYSLECTIESTAAVSKTTVGVSHLKVDEFGDIRSGDTKARLDNFAIELQNNPTLQAHLIVYAGRLGPRGQAARRAAMLKDYLVQTRGMEAERIITVEGGFRDELSAELWLSPRGASAPEARPTIDEGFVKAKGGKTNRE